jgi:molybdopterin molybdotransferase
MFSVLDARKAIFDKLSPLGSEILPVRESLGRNLWSELNVVEDLPAFDHSAMDGYAVNIQDLTEIPKILPVAFEVAAGATEIPVLESGMAARIFTGAMLPVGADTVLKQEDIELNGRQITVSKPATRGDHVRKRGSDLRVGDQLLNRGAIVSAARGALLAAQGIQDVEVFSRPSLGFLTTGNELVFGGEPLGPGQIRSCNGEIFHLSLQEYCAEVVDYGGCSDDPQELAAKASLSQGHDLFLISGGASVGDHDYTGRVIKEMGYTIHFERVAVRPGKPLIFATRGNRAIFGIPGNPVSSFLSCFIFVRDALAAMAGRARKPKRVMASLSHQVRKPGALDVFMRGNLDVCSTENIVRIDPNQGSGAIGALSRADCLVCLPAGGEIFGPGDQVEVLPFNDGEEWN